MSFLLKTFHVGFAIKEPVCSAPRILFWQCLLWRVLQHIRLLEASISSERLQEVPSHQRWPKGVEDLGKMKRTLGPLLSSPPPSTVKFARNLPLFTPSFGVRLGEISDLDTQILENAARGKSHQRFTVGRAKRREISLRTSAGWYFLGRHREGRREGVELLEDLHGFLRNPPLLKKLPPPF